MNIKKLVYLSLFLPIFILFQLIEDVPWWSFTFLLFLAGVVFPLKKLNIKAFSFGFFIGFFSWMLPILYFLVFLQRRNYAHTGGNVGYSIYCFTYFDRLSGRLSERISYLFGVSFNNTEITINK